MNPESIREARRILQSLVESGSAMLKSGRVITPADKDLLGVIADVAAKRLEEVEPPVIVEGFEPAGTHHTAPMPYEAPPEEPPYDPTSDPLP